MSNYFSPFNIFRFEAKIGECSLGASLTDDSEDRTIGTNATKGLYSDKEDHLLFPRCEFKTRYEGSTVFQMSNPEVHNTYYRSSGDRLSKNKMKKLVRNDNVNKSTATASQAHLTGNIVMCNYDKIFQHLHSKKRKNEDGNDGDDRVKKTKFTVYIYDDLLLYKLEMCNNVVEWFEKCVKHPNIRVYCENDYPCVMVQLKEFNKVRKEQSSLYFIAMAYFIGIANKLANTEGIPIELVIRSSFGHNIPSIAKTTNSFRISIGLIPKVYAGKVLGESLKILNNEFLNVLNRKLFNDSDVHELKVKNKEIKLYNKTKSNQKSKKVDKWKVDDTVLSVLRKTGDSSGRTVAFQIRRKRMYVEILSDYCHESSKVNNELSVEPLKKIITSLQYTTKKTKKGPTANVKLNVSDDYVVPKSVFEESNREIEADNAFWTIISKFSKVYDSRKIQYLSDAVKEKKMHGLYSKMEEANLQFIGCVDQKSENGYGSDSSCEMTHYSIEETIYAKKLTLATGMRAINVASFAAVNFTGVTVFNTEFMYYETERALKQICHFIKDLKLSPESSGQRIIRFIDLNYCCASGPNSTVKLENLKPEEKIIVFDYTSATHAKIYEVIKMFISHVDVLLFISSGIKNEQMGADFNPYGTIRIFAKDKAKLEGLFLFIKDSLGEAEKLPEQLHRIRKAYKSVGATVTSSRICDIGGWHYEKSLRSVSSDETRNVDHVSRMTKIWGLCFSGEYEYELEILLNICKRNVNELLSWQYLKIKDLGTDKVTPIMEEDIEYFDQILNCYEEDTEITKRLLDFVNDENVHVIMETGFNKCFDKYKTFLANLEECGDSEGSDFNFIDDLQEPPPTRLTGCLYKQATGSNISTPNSSEDEVYTYSSDENNDSRDSCMDV